MNNGLKEYDKSFFGHPKPLSSLYFAELWERFAFYGIIPLLALYMAAMVSDGGMGLDRPTASAIVGLFTGSLYLITIFGGWIADNWFGQAKAIWYGSIIISLGHLSIALDAVFNQFFFYLGLVLIVLGTGLFKTCISVIVGTLYSKNDSRRDAGFLLFYMGINIGGMIAPLITGLLIETHGWHWGFGAGGIGMIIALLIFKFISIPQLQKFNHLRHIENTWNKATNNNKNAPKVVTIFIIILCSIITFITMGFISFNAVLVLQYFTITTFILILVYFTYLIFFTKTTTEDKKKLFICFLLILSAAMFWAAYDQSATSVNLFTEDFIDKTILGFSIPTVWFYSLNSVFIITLAPLIGLVWVKLGQKNKDPSYTSKFSLALFLGALSFAILYLASNVLISNNGLPISLWWIVAFYFFITIGELCLSPIGLSCMTKLAPSKIQGQMMGLWFSASALGGMIAGLIGGHVSVDNMHNLPTIFLQCTLALFISAIILYALRKPIAKLVTPPNNSHLQ